MQHLNNNKICGHGPRIMTYGSLTSTTVVKKNMIMCFEMFSFSPQELNNGLIIFDHQIKIIDAS